MTRTDDHEGAGQRVIDERVFVLDPMSEQELRRAITGPSEAVGPQVDDGLIGGPPGPAPAYRDALHRLRRSAVDDQIDPRDVGGVAGHQERDGRGDLVGPARTPETDPSFRTNELSNGLLPGKAETGREPVHEPAGLIPERGAGTEEDHDEQDEA
jgi:hypothetical protein